MFHFGKMVSFANIKNISPAVWEKDWVLGQCPAEKWRAARVLLAYRVWKSAEICQPKPNNSLRSSALAADQCKLALSHDP
jgi:hypothetical protein